MKMKKLVAAGIALACALVTTGANAQKNEGRVITIREITIVGRVQLPIASVDVSKIPPKLTLAELRQPFLDRIEEAVKKDPF